MNDSCRLHYDHILLFNNSDLSTGRGNCGPWHLLSFCTSYFVHLTQTEASLSTVCCFLDYWTAGTFFFLFQICFCVLFPATARKERVMGRLLLSVRMHICSPKVLTFLCQISNGRTNSTLQWHVSLNSDYYAERRGFTSVVQLNVFTSVRRTEAGGMWRAERPYRARDRCWRVNLDLHSQIHFSGYMFPKPNSVIFRCFAYSLKNSIASVFSVHLFVSPSVRMYRLGTHGTDFLEILN